MANELLSLLFNGKFELLPYVINDSEFRMILVIRIGWFSTPTLKKKKKDGLQFR